MNKGFWLVVMAVSVASAQKPKASVAHKKMSDAFTTSALKSLGIISHYNGVPDKGIADGVERDLVDAMRDVDANARSTDEMTVVTMLRSFLSGRITNNGYLEDQVSAAVLAWETYHPEPPAPRESQTGPDYAAAEGNHDAYPAKLREAKLQLRTEVESRDVVGDMATREDACSQQLDAVLRAQVYRYTPACLTVSIPWKDAVR